MTKCALGLRSERLMLFNNDLSRHGSIGLDSEGLVLVHSYILKGKK